MPICYKYKIITFLTYFLGQLNDIRKNMNLLATFQQNSFQNYWVELKHCYNFRSADNDGLLSYGCLYLLEVSFQQ